MNSLNSIPWHLTSHGVGKKTCATQQRRNGIPADTDSRDNLAGWRSGGVASSCYHGRVFLLSKRRCKADGQWRGNGMQGRRLRAGEMYGVS